MLKIRLQRTGRSGEKTFRLVLTESKNATRSGKFLEIVGNHDFRNDKTEIKTDRVKHWMALGAQKTPPVKDEPKVEAKPAAAPKVEEAKA